MTNHLFDHLFAPDKPLDAFAVVEENKAPLTYRDLLDQSAKLANTLTDLGVKLGDRVAVQVEKSPTVIALYLATIRAGAIFLPLNTAYTAPEIRYFLSDAMPAIFVCEAVRKGEARALCAELGIANLETLDANGKGTLADKANAQPSNYANIERAPDDLAAILYTSGTTGRSKGAMLSHDNLLSNCRALAEIWRFTPDDVLIHALPVYHTHGLFVATNVSLIAGASMLWMARFDADAIIKAMPRATALMGVPTFYTRLLQHPDLNTAVTSKMRLFVSGSAPLLSETHRAWQTRTGHTILERYGMSETNMNTSNPYDGDRVAGTVGFPLPDVTIRITDAQSGTLLPDETIGMIEVKGPNVFQGYWQMPEKTASEFRPDGFFITGDVGVRDARGYLSIVGRDKDLVITGGFNVYPKEIEAEIDLIPGVLESAVFGVPHADFGEGVTAVIVRDGSTELDEKTILIALRGKIAKFKQPKRVLFCDEIPRNAMSKVQKSVLRERYRDLYGAASSP